MGEIALNNLGEYIQNDSYQNGFYGLRSALILSAAGKNSLNLIDVIKKFPSRTIRINSDAIFKIFGAFTELVDKTKQVNLLIQEQSGIEASKEVPSNIPELQKLAKSKWQKQTLNLNDEKRKRRFPVDIYLPELSNPASLVVISQGASSFGRNSQTARANTFNFSTEFR
jgi:hypothetical protein